MTDPFSLGASAVAFIGITGQVLQGCQYICNFVDDVRDAPDDILYFKSEIKGFRAAVLGFQRILQRFEHSANLETVAEQIGLALNSASLAINQLKNLIHEHDGKQNWWRDLKIAKKKAQFVKCVENLGRAKADIALAQSSSVLMLALSQSSKTHHTSLNISSLHSHTASISQNTALTQDIVRQLQESSLDTKNAVETMKASLSDRIGLLNESLEVILRTTINNVRDQFIAELNSKAQEIKPPSSPLNHASEIESNQFGAQNTKRFISTGSSQQFRRQVCYRRVYNVWFATITVTSKATTTQRSLGPYGDTQSSFHNDNSSRIIIDVRPHPWITLRGVLGFIERQSTGISSPNYDARLRIYSIVPKSAPIVNACETGDITAARKLLSTGQASLYDVALYTRGRTIYCSSTLLDLAISSWQRTVLRINGSKASDDISNEITDLNRKFELFAFLVDCGLDPGEQMSFLTRHISNLLRWACESPMNITAHLVDMLRCLISRSTMDPFAFSKKYRIGLFFVSIDVVPEIAACIRGQASWPLPEPLAEHEYNTVSEWEYLFVYEPAYSLLRDPTAILFRAALRWLEPRRPGSTMARVCLNILCESQSLSGSESGAWDLAIQARLIACLEIGMSPKDVGHRVYERDLGVCTSVAQVCMAFGKKHVLESALFLVGWTPDSICVMFEEEASALLARFLNSFKPVIGTSKAGGDLCHKCRNALPLSPCSKHIAVYLKNRDMALNEGYRRYFLEEEEEVLRIVSMYDRAYFPLLQNDLPAVNGIAQDFWD